MQYEREDVKKDDKRLRNVKKTEGKGKEEDGR
jgi:hypothetical protein